MQNLIRQSSSLKVERSLRRPLLAVLMAAMAAMLCLSFPGSAFADDDDDDGEFVSRQVVVQFKPAAKVAAFNKKFRTRTLQVLPGGERIYLLRTRPGTNPARLAVRMRADARVLFAEPNFTAGSPEGSRRHRAFPGGIPAPSSDSTQYQNQYAKTNLNLAEAHQTNRGAGTVVAVIDTGVQLGHPELSGRLTDARYDYIDGDRTPDDVGDGRDNDFDGEADEMVGHGTHVAGVVALAAPKAEIMPIRALDSEGRGSTFLIAKAIEFASRKGADVINLSLGSSRETDLLEEMMDGDDDDGGGRGPVFVAAAGNDNNAIEQHPAAEEDVVAVTSVDEGKKKSDFANFDGNDEEWVEVSAPGTDIHSPFPDGRYAVWSGTSMATPFVAGQAALVKSLRPGAGAECVVDTIEVTADRAALNAANPDYVDRLGSGHADAGASVEYARTTGCPTEQDD